MPLTDTAIKAAKPAEKPYKLFDERGLYLSVQPTGGRWWRFKYLIDGREKLLSLGCYPDVTLAMARARRDEARSLVADHKDPSDKRKADRAARSEDFKSVAREWLAKQQKRLGPRTFAKKVGLFEKFLFPYIGQHPIAKITPKDMLGALKRIEDRGILETAHRARSAAGCVFRYAMATGRAERDISADLRGAIAPKVTKNRAALTDPARIGELMRRIGSYHGQPPTEAALKLAPLLFVRPGELRRAEWTEIDLEAENPIWRIQAHRMKMREEHLVPLSTQAVAILKDLHQRTGGGRHVFPSLRGDHRPLSENTINVALRGLGYGGDEMTGHGFRAMASTCLNELGFAPDVIELQLAHAERNEVRAAYNRAKRLVDRRKMMQDWADYLDKLKSEAEVALTKSAKPTAVTEAA